MSEIVQQLRIFVAMPGTTMGATALWNNPDEITQMFFGGIRERAASELHRVVALFIEKDKEGSGDILASMYRECWDADVYIADLTGSNPNVYLELGARWAMRDKITIIVTQNVEELQFNVAAARSFRYSKQPELLQKAIDAVVRAIVEGLKSDQPDNPIREAVDIVVESRAEHARLVDYKSRYESATVEIGAAYVTAGKLATDPADKRECFQKAVTADPKSVDGWVGYVTELRNPGYYERAIKVANEGISHNPNAAPLYGQLGLAYNKQGQVDDAIAMFTRALALAPGDAELNSNLGGAWRRKAFATGQSHALSVPYADKARKYYREALRIAELDMSEDAGDAIAYALGNVARLDFVLTNYIPTNRNVARENLRRLRIICKERLERHPDDYYRRFDLADSYLLSGELPGELQEGIRLYREGIQSVPPSSRPDVLSSVADPLRQYLSLDLVGDRKMQMAMEEILKDLQRGQTQYAS